MSSKKAKPIQVIRFGSLAASIWKNKRRDGKNFLPITFTKTYRATDTDQPSSTNCFSQGDLPTLSLLAAEAHRTIHYF